MKIQLMTAALLLATSLGSAAQGNAAQGAEARCRRDVKEYVEAMRFVRQAAGPQIGDKVASGYVAEAEITRIAADQGPCAAAQVLREKGAIR